jgi:formylglycine-generating enzyme required for sulfatase activity
VAGMEDDPLEIVGKIIAEKYQVEAMVGEGGFAVVYRALHLIWKKPVAIKFFNGLSTAPKNQREALREAFIQEGALLTELSSETAGVVQARDVGTYEAEDGQWMPYMVLEWLSGSALDEVFFQETEDERPTWTINEVHNFLGRVLPALDIAHGKGIAHRDIKPANIFVLGEDARSPDTVIKLLDFGVAKIVSDNTELKAALAKTGMGISSFTPQYGAPEQFSRTYGATGPWTDVYAMALVAVEMLTGKNALEGEDLMQLGYATGDLNRRPTPRTLGIAVSDAVEAVFEKALSVRPADRHSRAGAFLEAITEALHDPSSPKPLSRKKTGSAQVHERTQLATPMQQKVFSAPQSALVTQSDPAQSEGSKKGLWIGVAAVLVLGTGIGVGLFGSQSDSAKASSEAAAASQKAASETKVETRVPVTPTCPKAMATIEKGQYFQGSDEETAPANEKPSHNVSLSSYCIDLHEVTAEDYKKCSDSGRCKRPNNQVSWPDITKKDETIYSDLCTFGKSGQEDYPINCVTWEMADIYCKAQEKRLPTEAEWEYATRGPDGRVYPWGDEEPTVQHLNGCDGSCETWGKERGIALTPLHEEDDGYPTLAPVGKFEAGRSRFGPYDVVGNVWEWVSDYYGDYDKEAKSDPHGPKTGAKRVIRGGGWNGSYTVWMRPSFRYAQVPEALSHGIGFRCANVLAAADSDEPAQVD